MNKLIKFDNEFRPNSNILCGVDEAGRGPLAGPVVAAAVIFSHESFLEGINDSKKISEKNRELFAGWIKNEAISYSYGIVEQDVIDNINILQAALKAMKEAVSGLSVQPNLVIIDGNKSFISNIPTKTIVKGDSKSFSIAAASILAKVKRDEIMKQADLKYPQYLWKKNKGYGTREHIKAIKYYGYSEFHRKTFLRKILNSEIQQELL